MESPELATPPSCLASAYAATAIHLAAATDAAAAGSGGKQEAAGAGGNLSEGSLHWLAPQLLPAQRNGGDKDPEGGGEVHIRAGAEGIPRRLDPSPPHINHATAGDDKETAKANGGAAAGTRFDV